MVVGLSGPTLCLSPGDEADFPEVEAMRLVAAGYAVAVVNEVERAVNRPVIERRKKG